MLQGCTVLKLCWMCLKTKSEWMKQRKTQDVRHKGKKISFDPEKVFDLRSEWKCGWRVRMCRRKIVFKKNSNITQGGSYKACHSLYTRHTSSYMRGGESCKRKRGIHSYVLLSLAFYRFLAFHSGTLPGHLKRSGASGLKSEKHPWLNYSVREFKGPMCNI